MNRVHDMNLMIGYGTSSTRSDSVRIGNITSISYEPVPDNPGMTLMDDTIKVYRNKIECGNSIIISPDSKNNKMYIADISQPEIKYEMTEIIDVIKKYKTLEVMFNEMKQHIAALEERIECMPFPGCEIYEKAKDEFYKISSM